MCRYETSGNQIKIQSPIASTLMMCEANLMAQESGYINSLGKAQSYTIKGDELTLFGVEESEIVKYRTQTQELAGTSWQVLAYNNGKQAVTSVINDTSMTIEFNTNGTLSGNSGCNSYSGSYSLSKQQIEISQLISTKKLCNNPPGIMEQEAMYLTALQSAATYLIEGKTLELRTRAGALAASFTSNQ
jgi:heat shock protein HslJ